MAQAYDAPVRGAPRGVKAQRPTWFLLSQHQFVALCATGLDYAVLILWVSVFGLSPVVGTLVGAVVGAVTSFVAGRRWVFEATSGGLRGQALRFVFVAAISASSNALGEWLLLRAGLQYLVARTLVAVLVGLSWNFPMHRYFVFRSEPRQPAR